MSPRDSSRAVRAQQHHRLFLPLLASAKPGAPTTTQRDKGFRVQAPTRESLRRHRRGGSARPDEEEDAVLPDRVDPLSVELETPRGDVGDEARAVKLARDADIERVTVLEI